jgi:hypothetical protein
MLNDEIMDEGAFRSLPAPAQSELIRQYCAPVTERLALIGDKAEAFRMMDAACREFETRCRSTVLRQAVRSRITALLIERWGDG